MTLDANSRGALLSTSSQSDALQDYNQRTDNQTSLAIRPIERPLPSPETLKEIAQGLALSIVQGLASNSNQFVHQYNQTKARSTTFWNGFIGKMIPEAKDANGIYNLSDKQIVQLQLRALLKPASIPRQDIPNKHFESYNTFNDFGEVIDWESKDSTGRFPVSSNLLENIKDGFKLLKSLEKSYIPASLIQKIGYLEADDWRVTFYPTQFDERLKNFDLAPIVIDLHSLPGGDELIDRLVKERERLQNIKQDKVGDKTFEKQVWPLGETLRVTKTINQVVQDPLYLKRVLLDPVKQALLMGDPNKVILIKEGFQQKMKLLFNDVIGLHEQALKNFTDEAKALLKEQNAKVIGSMISRITSKVSDGLMIGCGELLVESYGGQIGGEDSPLGAMPGERGFDQQNTALAEAYANLQTAFSTASQPGGRLNFGSLESIIARLLKHTAKPSKQNIFPDTLKNDDSSFSSGVMRAITDPSIEIISWSKEVYDQIFSSSDKAALLKSDLGFIPFAKDIQSQLKLEVILSSPKIIQGGIFPLKVSRLEMDGKKMNLEWTPALLSRIMFLYYTYLHGGARKEAEARALEEAKGILF
ncbi:MAG: hypothetical protein SFT81_04180 [Candidatus Caenarcaniphilales bacterium]|nr:hypothetical protein [Candidatus Caenarcaniphilales bacterium]